MVSCLLRSGAPHWAVVAGALAMGCATTKTAPPPSGLMVVISADLSPSEYDQIRVQVSQAEGVDSGSWHTWLDETKAVPSDVKLPTAFLVRAGSSGDQTALIQVTALLAGQPVVLREAQVSVPTNRLAELDLRLSEACKESTCPQGQSCQPPTGLCGTDAIPVSSLPPYPPSGATGEVDATDDGDAGSNADASADVASDSPASDDGNTGESAVRSLDAGGQDTADVMDAAGGSAVARACGDAGVCVVGGVLSVGQEPGSATLPDGTSVSVSNQRLEPIAAVCDPTGSTCVMGGIVP
jgi:hypothetical protein